MTLMDTKRWEARAEVSDALAAVGRRAAAMLTREQRQLFEGATDEELLEAIEVATIGVRACRYRQAEREEARRRS